MRLAPMMRSIDLILLVAVVAMISWTFKVKHDAQVALERVAELEKQIAAEKVEIDLLKSDWSLLTNPARLQALVERYNKELQLKQMDATQLATENDMPGFRVPNTQDVKDGYAGTDSSIATGSIGGDGE